MSLKQQALQALRRARLLETADAARFRWLARDSDAARSAGSSGTSKRSPGS